MQEFQTCVVGEGLQQRIPVKAGVAEAFEAGSKTTDDKFAAAIGSFDLVQALGAFSLDRDLHATRHAARDYGFEVAPTTADSELPGLRPVIHRLEAAGPAKPGPTDVAAKVRWAALRKEINAQAKKGRGLRVRVCDA